MCPNKDTLRLSSWAHTQLLAQTILRTGSGVYTHGSLKKERKKVKELAREPPPFLFRFFHEKLPVLL